MDVYEAIPSADLVRGSGKVELFEQDRCVECVEFHNAIHTLQLNYAAWRTRSAFSDTGNSPTSSTWQVSNGLSQNNNDPEPLQAMKALFCSTDTSAISTSDQAIKGEIIAWANKDFYVGNDVRRGGMNQSETLFSTSLARWVADWPTSSGNGTFRSIGWGYIPDYTITNPALTNGPFAISSRPSGGVDRIMPNVYNATTQKDVNANGAYSPAGDIYCTDQGRQLWRNYGESSPVCTMPDNASHISWSPSGSLWATGFYESTSTATTYRLYKINPATGAIITTTTFPTYPSGFTVDSTSTQSFTMVSDTEMYVVYGQNNRLYRLTLSGTVWSIVQQMPVPQDGFPLYRFISRYPNGDLLTGNSYNPTSITRTDPTTGEIKWMVNDNNAGMNQPAYVCAAQDGTDKYASIGGMNVSGWYPVRYRELIPTGLATRVLLPAPVTKTNLQTMKITYQFDFT